MSRVTPVALVAGSNVVGSVITNNVDIIEFTITADTSIYADNDVLSISAEVTNFFRTAGGAAKLVSATLFDGDDQGTEVEVFFTTNATTPGTINGAISAADTVMDDIQGSIIFVTYSDLINSQVCTLPDINLILQAAAGSTSIYVWSAVRSGTPTYTAAGLKLKLGVERY